MLTHGYRSVDQYWIQDVSMQAQAAIGSSVFVLIMFAGGFELVAFGTSPLVARATGAGDPEGRRRSLGAGVFAGLWVTAATMSAGFFASQIAETLGLHGQTAVECERYLQTIAWTALPLVFTPLVDHAFIAMGNARLPMLLHAVSLAVNIVLTPLLIYGADLGIVGAALASNASRALSTGAGFVLLVQATGLERAHVVSGPELRRVLRIGLPIASGTITYALVYWAMLRTSISPLGPHVNAALGIGFSALEGVAWPCFHGVSIAVASFVGRSLGAGSPEQARAAYRLALPSITILGLAATGAFSLGGRFLTGLFAAEPLVHDAATEYALILAASQLFVAWESLSEGVLLGAGDTRTVFWLSVPANLLRVPLAWWLAFPLGLGAAGVWWAINITTYAKALSKAWAVRRGGWATITI